MLLKERITILPFGLLLFGWSSTAEAYLDPGTGSMMIQIAIGSFLAAVCTVKIYWKKLKTFFSKKKNCHPGNETP